MGRPAERMPLRAGLAVALGSLRANKLRSGLTMLGIIIGVAAMITMVALGSGAREAVSERITALGADLLFLRPGAASQGAVRMASSESENLKRADAEAIAAQCGTIVAVVPEVSRSYQVKFGNKNWNTRVTGTTADYEWVRNTVASRGAWFTSSDNERRERTCVLGPVVAENLFAGEDPVGQVVRIQGIGFTVKGVLAEKGVQGWMNPDDQIFIPLDTALYRLMGRDDFGSLTLKVADPALTDMAILEVESLMRQRHRLAAGAPNDFNLRTMADVASTLTEATSTFTGLLASIALVSLVVGGIGIMNIMLVSVTERTREIGVRMAIGARRGDILMQFLVESTTLSVVGGLAGIAFGIGVAMVMSAWYGWNTIVSGTAVAVSFLFAALVGVTFGLYPARKAARLDPIESLRYE